MVDWDYVGGAEGPWPGTDDYEDAHTGPTFRRNTRTPQLKKCARCGNGGLRWKQHESGKWWFIENDGSWHTCPPTEEMEHVR